MRPCRRTVLCEQWTADKAVDVFLQLACGVKHLHACGVLHRDLKTDNALISSTAPLVVKWADFGVSVQLDVESTYGDGKSAKQGGVSRLVSSETARNMFLSVV